MILFTKKDDLMSIIFFSSELNKDLDEVWSFSLDYTKLIKIL